MDSFEHNNSRIKYIFPYLKKTSSWSNLTENVWNTLSRDGLTYTSEQTAAFKRCMLTRQKLWRITGSNIPKFVEENFILKNIYIKI